MVYWADLLYERPADPGVGHESNILELEQSVDADMRISTPMTHRLGDGVVEGLALSVGFMDIGATPEVVTDPIMSDTPLEASAPGFLKRRLMRVLLRDVHHFFDAEFSPRPGVTFHIRQEIRRRMLDALVAGAERTGPHGLGHSLGSVAHDALTGVPGAPAVDALVTIGSLLGISEVQEGSRHRGRVTTVGRVLAWAWWMGELLRPARSRVRWTRPASWTGLPPPGRKVRRGRPCDQHRSWRHSIDKYWPARCATAWRRRRLLKYNEGIACPT